MDDPQSPIIVVSDVHLGSDRANSEEFQNFLDWLRNLDPQGFTLELDKTKIDLKRPETIVLLGDILDFWDPKDGNRDNIIKDIIKPLSTLSRLDHYVIYVIGNHDEKLLGIWEISRIFPYGDKGKLEVAFRTYPEQNPRDNKIVGIKIGEKRFAFLHGHQFDTFQIFYRISRMIKFRFDPIDWCQDIANVYINKYIKFSLNRPTMVFGVIFIIFIISYIVFRATPIGSWLGILLVLFSFLITVTMVPKFIINAAIPVYESLLKAKHESADEVIKARYNYEKGKKIEADIVVFGHTHIPDMYYMKEIDRLFINTGCWVDEDKIEREKQNTFVYIDSLDQYLLKYRKEKIICLSKGSEVISSK